MRHSVSGGLVVLLGMFAGWASPPVSVAGGPPQYDGQYTAFLSCDALPQEAPMRNQPFTLGIVGGDLTWDRAVRMPNGVTPTGVTEHAKGAVSPDGKVSVSGSAGNSQWSFKSSFQGQFDGTTLHLTGTQVWKLPSETASGTFTRACTVSAVPHGQ